jgi:hypothetical protein
VKVRSTNSTSFPTISLYETRADVSGVEAQTRRS